MLRTITDITALVTIARQGPIAVVLLDNPPVNALSVALRKEMSAAFETVRDDPELKGMVLVCAGRTFVAGADITEFGKPAQPPSLSDLIAILERFEKPVRRTAKMKAAAFANSTKFP